VIEADALLALLDRFHITDRRLVRARDAARARNDAAALAALRREAARYFASLERETAAALASIDRKLDDLYQRQYNLQAERGVAERRLQGAREMLEALRERAAQTR
jgi:membrane-anchored protein YejM (alkaline phosphatase superfamily)